MQVTAFFILSLPWNCWRKRSDVLTRSKATIRVEMQTALLPFRMETQPVTVGSDLRLRLFYSQKRAMFNQERILSRPPALSQVIVLTASMFPLDENVLSFILSYQI